MISNLIRWIYFSAVFGFLCARCLPLYCEDNLQSAFLTESNESWKKVRQRIEDNCDVATTGSELKINGVSQGKEGKLRIRTLGVNELSLSLSKDGHSSEYLDAVNKEYSFSLRRDSTDSSFQLENLYNDTQTLRTKHQWRHGHLQACIALFDGIMVEGEWLEDFFKSPGIEIVSVTQVTDGDSDSDVAVTFRGKHRVDKYNIVSDGTITLIPSKFWNIRSYSVNVRMDHPKIKDKTSSKINKTIEYQDFEGIPFPKNTKTECILQDGTNRTSLEEYGQPVMNAGTGEFYLPAYGFGNPPGMSQSRMRFITRVILVVGGLVLIFLALGMKFWKRKA